MASSEKGEKQGKMNSSTPGTKRISTFVVAVIFITLALSLTAIILGINSFNQDSIVAGYLFLVGFLGVALSTYVLFQTRRRIQKLKIEIPPITTTIECEKCGFKSVRDFKRGDFVYKEVETCQKCNENMLITAIYRVFKGKKEQSRF